MGWPGRLPPSCKRFPPSLAPSLLPLAAGKVSQAHEPACRGGAVRGITARLDDTHQIRLVGQILPPRLFLPHTSPVAQTPSATAIHQTTLTAPREQSSSCPSLALHTSVYFHDYLERLGHVPTPGPRWPAKSSLSSVTTPQLPLHHYRLCIPWSCSVLHPRPHRLYFIRSAISYNYPSPRGHGRCYSLRPPWGNPY
ncbi:hypothetical protein E2C01_032928 [Portunus trituberculatus]|uniref:Uncharacterized protein n=1 Tax=Portunus trituberculatus TaxID=210409 RepID=A0A5B7F2T3_PORTR|nr:hypothetical protein [Portunus trituberculatus]